MRRTWQVCGTRISSPADGGARLNSAATQFIIGPVRWLSPRRSTLQIANDLRPETESLKWPAGLSLVRTLDGRSGENASNPLRSYLATAVWPLADGLLFAAALNAGLRIGPAHMASFAIAALLNYVLNVRAVVAAAGRARDPRLYGHLIAVSLIALFLRGGVLALLTMVWGWPPLVAIVFAIAVTMIVMQAGYALSLSSGIWRLGSGARWRAIAMALILCAFLLRLIYLAQVQLLPEETYYWNYSRHLDIGYLDHPPMVAWLIRLGTAVFGDSEFGVRIGALFCGAVASFFTYRLTRNLFDEPSALVALVLMQVLPFFFFAGILMTPDAPLTAAWAASLYYLERALIGGRAAAWWAAGISLGLGLLSKYTIGMLVPAMLIFMVVDSQARRWLWHWLPYAAVALALAIFSPVIIWNATHDWASFAFQTSRRLAEAPKFSLHKLIASALVLLTPAGFLTLATALRGGSRAHTGASGTAESPRRWRFLQLAVLVPLTVFVAFSLRHDVKLDWTGALWIAAVPAFAYAIVSSGEQLMDGTRAWARAAWVPTSVTLLLIYGAFFHYLVLGLPGIGYGKQMELIPIGWRDLGAQLTAIQGEIRKTGTEPLVVGMDRYMLASELAFYAPDHARSVSGTSSEHLFGSNGLMYERWFPPGQQEGRTLLLVGWSPEDVTGAKIEARVKRLEPLQAGVLTRDGKAIRRYYYRVAYGYKNVSTPE
ncbi:MAG: glycosyltransferase [Gammaproteobacteria bacterium]|nr:glycosyltransferase [Gammaproteobacteria bacterium]